MTRMGPPRSEFVTRRFHTGPRYLRAKTDRHSAHGHTPPARSWCKLGIATLGVVFEATGNQPDGEH